MLGTTYIKEMNVSYITHHTSIVILHYTVCYIQIKEHTHHR